MNRINPLYILAFVFVLAIYSFLVVKNKEKEFQTHTKNYNDMLIIAKEYKSLKTNKSSKNKTIAKINSIKSDRSFKKAKIIAQQNKKGITLNIETTDYKVLNRFLNRVLNEKLSVKKFEISTHKIKMEVGL